MHVSVDTQWHVMVEPMLRPYGSAMTPNEMVAAFEATALLPPDVIRAATAHADAIAPHVLAVIEKAGSGALLVPCRQRLLRRGLHVLAAARQTAVWKPLLRLLQRNRNELDRCLGLAVTETLATVLLATYDGEVETLLSAVADKGLDGYVRWALLGTLARLTFDGAVSHATARRVLESFERDGWAEPGDAAWEGWQNAIRLLGLTELADRVRATWSDGRNTQSEADRQDWEEELAAARAAPADVQRFIDDRLQPLADAATALLSLEGESRSEPCSDDQHEFGELDQDEIDWLHDCLHHTGAAMNVERLDGFLTAIVVNPVSVSPSECTAAIWGKTPAFDDAEQADLTIDLIERHQRSIARRLEAHQPLAAIMADVELTANAWADGFMRGVSCRMDVWDRRLEHDEQLTSFLGHILMLAVSSEDAEREGITPEKRDGMVESLSLAVLGLFLYWREKPIGHRLPVRAARQRAGKIGRNEPCHCGSGKKFKRCCGSAELTLH